MGDKAGRSNVMTEARNNWSFRGKVKLLLGQSGWFFAPSFDISVYIPIHPIFSRVTFRMMGVTGVLSMALLCAIHGAIIIENILFEEVKL